MDYSIALLYIIIIIVIIYMIILSYEVFSNPTPLPPTKDLEIPAPPIHLEDTYMRTDMQNTMIDGGSIVMMSGYVPTSADSVITKLNMEDTLNTVIDDKLLTVDGNNKLVFPGTLQMYDSYTPMNEYDVTTKKYLEEQLATNIPEATVDDRGVIRLSGALSGTGDMPSIADNVLTLDKFSDITPNNLLGSDINGQIIEYSISDNFILNNANIELINVVKTVNGAIPDSNGDVNVLINTINVGLTDAFPANPQPGELFVINKDDALPENNGRLFLYTDTDGWVEIIANSAILDTRYLNFNSDNEMNLGSSIKMSNDYVPSDIKDVATKEYVDSEISNLNVNVDVPDATINTKGIVQLAGDLTGTADSPTIADNAVTTEKLAPLSDVNMLLGSTDVNMNVQEIKLDPVTFSITNDIISVIPFSEYPSKFLKRYRAEYAQDLIEGDPIVFYNTPGNNIIYSTSSVGLNILINSRDTDGGRAVSDEGMISITLPSTAVKQVIVKVTGAISGIPIGQWNNGFLYRLTNETNGLPGIVSPINHAIETTGYTTSYITSTFTDFIIVNPGDDLMYYIRTYKQTIPLFTIGTNPDILRWICFEEM
jgi:hypothetical protein